MRWHESGSGSGHGLARRTRAIASHPGDATEIDRIEVRNDLRGQCYGRDVVAHLTIEFPGPLVASSKDERSDRFWRSLGWTEHLHLDEGIGASLFVNQD